MGEQEASRLIESVFESWGPSLARYVYRATGSRELADDFVQEAFMALYRELRLDKKVENPRGWTLTVVRHHISKYERSLRRHGEQLEPSENMEAFQTGPLLPTPPEDDLTALFSVLSDREEEVVLLRMESLKYREIADQLGISIKSVGTLLARALRKLHLAVKAKALGRPIPSRTERHVPETLQ